MVSGLHLPLSPPFAGPAPSRRLLRWPPISRNRAAGRGSNSRGLPPGPPYVLPRSLTCFEDGTVPGSSGAKVTRADRPGVPGRKPADGGEGGGRRRRTGRPFIPGGPGGGNLGPTASQSSLLGEHYEGTGVALRLSSMVGGVSVPRDLFRTCGVGACAPHTLSPARSERMESGSGCSSRGAQRPRPQVPRWARVTQTAKRFVALRR